jgi:hypothetical protein
MSTLDEVLARGRAAAESLMTTTFTMWVPGENTIGDDEMTHAGFDIVGTVRGRLQDRGRDTSIEFVEIGQIKRPVLREGLHIPIGAPVPTAGGPGEGWEYECTALGASDDPSLLGRRYRVIGAPAKSAATARRLDVVEL